MPLIPTDRYKDKPIGPSNPLYGFGFNTVTRITQLRKMVNIILQLVKWIFLIARINPGFNLEEFIATNFYVRQEKVPITDSSQAYDLSKIPRKLPQASSLEEAYRTMNLIAPTLFAKDGLIMYNQTFYDRVTGTIRTYAKEIDGLTIPIPAVLHNLYTDETDFLQQEGVLIFLRENDINSWLRSIGRPGYNQIIIKDKLDISYALLDEPYIYRTEEGKIYLVQNILGSDWSKALNLAHSWSIQKVNYGPSPPSIPPDRLNYIIYSISSSLSLTPTTDKSNGTTDYLQILSYGSKRYGALLPLV